eukprot:6201962-Pleurochrysis_carterae.AAC.3
MVSIIVAYGATLNIAADRIHPIGSWGKSHISLHQRKLLSAPVRDPFNMGVKGLICIVIVPSVETPNAIGDIAIS